MEISNKIQVLRKKAGISQEELAEKVGVARQTISKWELGETSPDLKQSKKMCAIFNISLDELFKNKQVDTFEIKVSNIDNLYRKPLKIKSLIRILFIIIIIFTIGLVITFSVKKYLLSRRIQREQSINCILHNEKYSYKFRFYEDSGYVIEAGGDAYLAHITDLEEYKDANQALAKIDAYVKNNGGSCIISD